jgi:ABC-2 type transport system permease protein
MNVVPAGSERTAGFERRGSANFARAVRSEATKLATVASTWWLLAAATALTAGGVALAAVSTRSQHQDGVPEAFTTSAPFVAGQVMSYLVQWAVVIIGVTMMTSEYQTGSALATFQWVPSRTRVLMAKAALLGLVLVVLGAVFAVVSLGISIVGLGDYGDSYTTGEAYAAVLGIALYLPMIGVFSLGLAVLMRSAAPALAVAFVLLLVLPVMLPAVGLDLVAAYLPGDAGAAMMHGSADDVYPRAAGGLVVLGWTLVSLLAGRTMLERRDV